MTPRTYDALKRQITAGEGRRGDVYDDANGRTITKGSIVHGHPTIGIGWNLDAHPLPAAIIDLLYDLALEDVLQQLDRRLPWWRTLDEIAQRVLVDLGYNLGVDKLLTFDGTLAHLRQGDRIAAAQHLEATPWYQQVGSRGVTLCAMLRTQADPFQEVV